ncbi:VacJ family lipoprotein [Pseudooceanicola sediminis]|uniref:VacJ family lipoprotein n=1 Tax=Pseudooceanicola sediminis TaxID=2211117 RepID=A0A399J3N1_9RHOB|nr:VacJ family lipoprotein [Pseudooceanicola sediminis]KAA2312548.1 VacJ family lipoprotein [Puniceibacterium sp. HSS470]RII37556.1 VacJ family lipoprotein [Pseudooceanicola sediminis]|tara:strand:- start:36033 stop:36878 length:846 start_codon:yes stop_codon:yes gene_type:complete
MISRTALRATRTALTSPRAVLSVILVAATLASAGCTRPAPEAATQQYFDPYEARNRKIHNFNKGLDKAVLRPVGVAYATVVPEEFATLVTNFGENLATPADVVNDVLQFRLKDAFVNTVRFTMNSTIGLGGLIDAATLWGIPARDTDFGETLYVWGVPEGAYMELPIRGPSTERDTAGRIVDFFTNPLGYVLDSPEKSYGTQARVVSAIGYRGRYADTVDSVLYDSADSYAQSRSIYLQRRHYQLGDIAATSQAEDAYTDPYGAPAASNTYDDPYGDPYAE